MAKRFVLDTSAIFAFTQNEEGSDSVADILSQATRGKVVVYLSFISVMEIYYVTWQVKGESLAKELIVLLNALPLELVDSHPRLTLAAGRIKARHRLSVADAFVGATAVEKQATLVHKDPELAPLSAYVELLNLPYKKSVSRS